MKSGLASCQVVLLLILLSGTRSQNPPSVPSEGADSQDLNIDESHAAFSYLIPPPRLATPYNGRNREWRHISETPPFRSVWNPTSGYDAKQSFPDTNHKVNINYPVERPSIKRPTHFHPSPLSFNPYIRLNDKEIYRANPPKPSRYQPHSGFSNFHIESQDPKRAPGNPKRELHYIHDLSSEHIQRGQLIFRQEDELTHGNDRQRDEYIYNDKEGSADKEGNPSETPKKEPGFLERERDKHPHISADHSDNSQPDHTTTTTKRTSFLQPGNLAALLAGVHTLGSKSLESDAGPTIIGTVESTIEPTPTEVDDNGLKNGGTSKTRTSVPIGVDEHKPEASRTSRTRKFIPSEVDEHESKTDGTSRTRTSVPEHIMRHEHHSSSEYYDELYDEFLDFYYDADGRSEGKVKDFKEFVEEKRRGNLSPKEDHYDGTTRGLRTTTLNISQSKQPNINISPSTSESTSPNTFVFTSPSISSTHKFPPTFKTTTSFNSIETSPTSTLPSTSSVPTSFANISTVNSSTTPPIFTLVFSTLVPISSTTSQTPTTSTLPTLPSLRPTTSKPEKNKEAITTSPKRPTRPSPISLSEILQELGLSLPQFLGTLAVHGSSLKEFTEKLRTKSISKAEFRRAKGNVKRLLEILESSPNRPQKNTITKQDQTTTTPSFTTKHTTSSSQPPLFSITTLKKVETTTQVSQNAPQNKTKPNDKPRIFGSRPSGVSLTKLESVIPGSDEKTNNSSSRTKPSIVVELDIAKLVKEKGVSASAILQDFKTMFNISETTLDVQNKTEPTTSKSPIEETTTKPLRPYKKQSYRPYRPLKEERGNSKIHRGLINHRLSSTNRPTLRPPYVPSPPSINFGESIENVAWNNFYKKNETKLSNDSNKESKREDKSLREEWDENYGLSNYKIIKTDPDALDVSTRSAIMAAGILGGVALSVFIAIFVVVKYRNHVHRNRRRIPLALASDSSSSSLPPLYASRSGNVTYSKECYQTSGFWTSLKKRFDPYSPSSSPTSM